MASSMTVSEALERSLSPGSLHWARRMVPAKCLKAASTLSPVLAETSKKGMPWEEARARAWEEGTEGVFRSVLLPKYKC